MTWWDKLKSRFTRTPTDASDGYGFGQGSGDPVAPSVAGSSEKLKRRWGWRMGGIGLALLLLLGYYLLGALLLTRVDDTLNFRPGKADLPAGGSETAAMMSALLDREVNGYGWKPNNPWIYPTALMDNMPNYQLGILASLRPVGLELRDSVGRLRGSGGTDADLEAVYSAISYAPDRWFIGSKFPFLGMSSESQYRDAIKGLRQYNARVGSGQATYERRVDTLVRLLDRLSLSLGNASNDLDKRMQSPGGLFDTKADDVFYRTKGQCYAAYLLLSAMRNDYSGVVKDRAVANLWADMMDELKQAVVLDPWIVSNGKSDDVLVQNHLAAQGVHLERARQRLREISGILQQ
jgi:Uncharacterized protein conserved in bacteria (DUF2333)